MQISSLSKRINQSLGSVTIPARADTTCLPVPHTLCLPCGIIFSFEGSRRVQLIFLLYAFLTGSHVALLRFVSQPGDLLGSTQVPCAMWNIYAECKGRKLCSHLHSVKPKHIADCVFKLNTCRVKHFCLIPFLTIYISHPVLPETTLYMLSCLPSHLARISPFLKVLHLYETTNKTTLKG